MAESQSVDESAAALVAEAQSWDLPSFSGGEQARVQLVAGAARWSGQDGDLIVLDSAAAAPLDVRVDGRVVARGEPLVVEGKLALRITELLPEPGDGGASAAAAGAVDIGTAAATSSPEGLEDSP